MSDEIKSPFLTTRETADWLRVGTKTLERWRMEGRGPRFHKVGKLCNYRLDDLERFAQSVRREQGAA